MSADGVGMLVFFGVIALILLWIGINIAWELVGGILLLVGIVAFLGWGGSH